ncbi:uncharacterized protein [Miscanthus floridulus]|uniref:uncharacterized protein n=1 Tax=Miscanthus floridulus TaxID=154761 RepID=UPI003458BF94
MGRLLLLSSLFPFPFPLRLPVTTHSPSFHHLSTPSSSPSLLSPARASRSPSIKLRHWDGRRLLVAAPFCFCSPRLCPVPRNEQHASVIFSASMELRAWLLVVWVLGVGVGAVFVARVRRDYRAIQARRAAAVVGEPLPPRRRLTRIEAFGRLLYVLFCRRGD